MNVYRHYQEMRPTPRVGALGNFDGVHLGHRALLKRVLHSANDRNLRPAVLTFDPHPVHVLAPQAGLRLISSVEQRISELQAVGVKDLLVQHFDMDFAALSAEAFVHDVLVEAMGLRHIIVGYDFGFGHKRSGTVETLATLAKVHGFSLEVVAPQSCHDGKPISSTRVRTALAAGNLDDVHTCLGRRFSFSGSVVMGDQRGRDLGFPTANLSPKHAIFLAQGVYAVLFDWGEGSRLGVANIGSKPTFVESTQPTIEVHVLDETGLNLYGVECTTTIVARLRAEQAFSNVEALKAQITKDCQSAREVLGSLS